MKFISFIVLTTLIQISGATPPTISNGQIHHRSHSAPSNLSHYTADETQKECVACPICYEALSDVGRATLYCKHTMCIDCFARCLAAQLLDCPECRGTTLSKKTLTALFPERYSGRVRPDRSCFGHIGIVLDRIYYCLNILMHGREIDENF